MMKLNGSLESLGANFSEHNKEDGLGRHDLLYLARENCKIFQGFHRFPPSVVEKIKSDVRIKGSQFSDVKATPLTLIYPILGS